MYQIETARLKMRVFQPSDLDEYQAKIYGDAQVTRYLPGGQPRPIEKTKVVLDTFVKHAEQYGYTVWAVFEKSNNNFIGHCGLYVLDTANSEVEVAYAFAQDAWGKGYASEAAHASLRVGFETCGLDRIIALALPPNLASQRVMQKIGMTHQGITEQYYNTTAVLYTMTRDEFQPGEAPFILTETSDGGL